MKFLFVHFFLIVTPGLCKEITLRVEQISPPHYSRLARAASLQGTVTVDIQIDQDGKVIEAKATSRDGLLKQETEKNIRTWTFRIFGPSVRYPFHHRITFVYRLEGKPIYEDSDVVTLRLPDRVEIVSPPMKVHINYANPQPHTTTR